ncbi:alpha/beta fold hydrolase [Actinoplanes sp. CA-015351]|uniref:alpha/beta fold hydrolase n=1 Tax=Actinoplanes sp. CA-015351 TaxID=3239897 RepID=UPI003D99BDCA
MGYVTAADGARIFYKDWGSGRPVVLSHGWPLTADSWESQQFFLASHGYRVIAHDRRGHGRSTPAWHGNDMDTYADDLSRLIETLDLRTVTLVGFSLGGGEIARYAGRHGTSRIAQVVLVAAASPSIPGEIAGMLRAGSLANRSQLYQDLADGPFFGNNRPGADVSPGVRDAFWLRAMTAYALPDWGAVSDWAVLDVPVLVIHGGDDQIVPSAARVSGAELLVYPGAPHGITETHHEQLSRDLLTFLNSFST